MSIVWNLSTDIVISLMSNWLQLNDITKYNSASCNKEERIQFENLISDKTFSISECVDWCSECSSYSEQYSIEKWKWIQMKQIHLEEIIIHDIKKSFNQHHSITSFHVSRIKVLKFTEVNTNINTGEMLIQFINQCEQLKVLCFDRCDLLNGIEFIPNINIKILDELNIINCEQSCVGSNSLNLITNGTTKLKKCHIMNFDHKQKHHPFMTFYNFENLLSRSGTYLVDLFINVDLRDQNRINHREIFKLIKTMIHCLSIRIHYQGQLSVILFGDLWPCIQKNHEILRFFEIAPVFSEKNITTFAYWIRKYKDETMNGLDMCNIECTSVELISFFKIFCGFGTINFNNITCINEEVLSSIVEGSSNTLRSLSIEENGSHLCIP